MFKQNLLLGAYGLGKAGARRSKVAYMMVFCLFLKLRALSALRSRHSNVLVW